MSSPNNNSNLLILEDDLDQMDLLIDLARSEIKRIMDDETISGQQRQTVTEIGIIKVSNIDSLQKAVSIHKNIFLAVLDCNTPDTKDSPAHDQLVKTNHRITGQHRSVDIVTQHLPNTPITLISSLNRFQRTVNRYYESKHNLRMKFIRKSDPLGVTKNIEYHLKEYLSSIN